MTREEAINELKILREEYWDDDGYGHETKQYDDTITALDMAIKALEQTDVLDKIRARIKKLQKMCDTNDLNLLSRYSAFGIALDVIDEYRTETEKESESE